ncbi:5-formyltetrahydrofolate cyclo-ligase [Siminovitchia sediminis]|uniref:5-formyltetrahydrofolate cyclo-ligase n=1 Tax=Siminovitchia sediminis TaxID=1274353 RepID=A0ABW4KD00_9BACI
MDKKTIRQQMNDQLKELNRLEYEQYSYDIALRLTETEEWRVSRTIGLTVSRFPEVDTWQLIRMGWKQGKRIVVPKCIPEVKGMSFRELTAFTQLENSFFGLLEPNESETNEMMKESIDLLIVPGLVYNRTGYRIGFGGGYYDRFLKDYQGQTISIAFSRQIINEIPIEQHDIPVQKVVTEKGIIDCLQSK